MIIPGAGAVFLKSSEPEPLFKKFILLCNTGNNSNFLIVPYKGILITGVSFHFFCVKVLSCLRFIFNWFLQDFLECKAFFDWYLGVLKQQPLLLMVLSGFEATTITANGIKWF